MSREGMPMRARQAGSAGSHKGFIHKKVRAHCARIFAHGPGKVCAAQRFGRDAYFAVALIRSPSCQRDTDPPPPGRFHGTDPPGGQPGPHNALVPNTKVH